jgi:small-conductance mechanosensitive channel
MELFERTFYGNPLKTWTWALVTALATLVVLRVLHDLGARRLAKMAARTKTMIDDRVADLLKRTKLFFIVAVALYAGSLVLDLPPKPQALVHGILVVAVVLQLGLWVTSLLGDVVAYYVQREIGEGAEAVGASTALNFVGKLVVWAGLLLWALDNIGWEVSTLVAGLGVTGIAAALAAQNLLGDLFASFSILFDKPFVIGDFIVVDDCMGTIERIGLKTTRLRSLSGEQLIMSNADLLKSRIHNYKRLKERRILFSIGVLYETPHATVAAIPRMIREIIEAQSGARFDRAHFAQYGDSSLVFEIVYWVMNPDYNTYMDIQQAINLAIFRKFEEEGIGFAYPTRTLYLKGEPESPQGPKNLSGTQELRKGEGFQ